MVSPRGMDFLIPCRAAKIVNLSGVSTCCDKGRLSDCDVKSCSLSHFEHSLIALTGTFKYKTRI